MNLTPQQKLEILCAYLPHGVEVKSQTGNNYILSTYNNMVGSGMAKRNIDTCISDDYRPILRHPDDMTDEEYAQVGKIIAPDKPYHFELIGYNYMNDEDTVRLTIIQSQQIIQYLNSLHIDTFGAIEAGWAIRKETN